jgi:hypothetical protein
MNFVNNGTVVARALHDSFEEKQTLIQLDIVSRMNNLGVAAIESSDHEQAGHFLRRALDKASETTFYNIPYMQPHVMKGNEVSSSLYVYQRGEYDEGMHTFSIPLTLDPFRTTVPKAIATVLFNLGIITACITNGTSQWSKFSSVERFWSSECQRDGDLT